MNLESIAKYFAPKSPMFSDSSRATATDNLTGQWRRFMEHRWTYADALNQLQNSMKKFGSAFSKLCVLLHTRITPVVRQAFADVTAAMVAALPKSRYSPTKSNTLTASRQNGQKLQRVFTPHTGRSGNQFGRTREFGAKRVTAARGEDTPG